MRTVNPLPADIILYPVTPQSRLASRTVAAAQLLLGVGHGLEGYSHAAVMAHNGWEFEAKWPKTGLFKIDRTRPFEVWRVRGLTSGQRSGIIRWCSNHMDEWYGLQELVTFGVLHSRDTPVCSVFVGDAYASVGYRFNKEGKRILAPNPISDDPNASMIMRHLP